MPNFFVKQENIENDLIFVTNQRDISHITNVLRLKKGADLIITGEDGFIYNAKITDIKYEKIQTKVIEKIISDKKLNINITLAQSVLKSAKQDIVIQKATELGVNTIIPLITDNTVVKFNDEKDRSQKIARWERICYESIKQCERAILPAINEITDLNSVVALNGYDLKVACVERDTTFTLKEILSKNKNCKNILVLIGPEGGWTDKEIGLFSKAGIEKASLGNLIYRAETAVISAVAGIIYEYEL